MSAQEALNESTTVVQDALNRALSPARGVIVPWRYFLTIYFLLLVGAAVGIYLRETRIYRAPARSRKRTIDYDYEQEHEFLIKGTRSSYLRSQWAGGWLCASRGLIGVILCTGGPILVAIVASFC